MPDSTYYAVLLALVLGVGCGGGKEKATPKAEPKVEAKKTEPTKETPKKLIADPIIEKEIRFMLNKPTGELTEADLEKLTQLTHLDLRDNPDLTKAQIAELQQALPKCEIHSNPTKQPPNAPPAA